VAHACFVPIIATQSHLQRSYLADAIPFSVCKLLCENYSSLRPQCAADCVLASGSVTEAWTRTPAETSTWPSTHQISAPGSFALPPSRQSSPAMFVRRQILSLAQEDLLLLLSMMGRSTNEQKSDGTSPRPDKPIPPTGAATKRDGV